MVRTIRDSEMATDIIVAGHICLDIIPDLSIGVAQSLAELLHPGQLVEVGALTLATGGAVSNTGLALHRLGIHPRLMGKLGNDLLGEMVRQVIGEYDPALLQGTVVDALSSTSYTVILSAPGVDRTFLHYPGANATFNADDIRYDIVEQACLFHFGYPTLMREMYARGAEQTVAMFKRVKSLGVTTSLDVSLPDPHSEAGQADWCAILRDLLPYVDIFLPNVDEALFMLRREVYLEQLCSDIPLIDATLLSELSDELLAYGGKVVGFKLGNRGFYAHTAGEATLATLGAARPGNLAGWANIELWAPCFLVDVVGTTGAGDAAIAGFLAALLRGLSLEEAVTMATAVGACNVEAADALGGIRSWEETLARVQGGWRQQTLELDAPGWYWDNDVRLWKHN
ncbi:MAG: carbohydrate kinase family protein [Anaerolineae bacterium]|nr:carbohydrate kinase family protein [Anaerolineae bacterium]